MIALHAAVVALATLGAGETVLLDFYADWCGPCRQMSPTIDSLAALGYPVRKVNIDHDRALAQQYGVQGIPCFVLLVNGQEVDRTVGAASSDSLKRMFAKAGVGTGGNATAAPPQQLATAPQPATSPMTGVPSLDSFLPGASDPQQPAPAGGAPQPFGMPLPAQAAQAPLGAAAPQTAAAPQSLKVDVNQLLAASVRIKIEDGSGNDYGSGTIIDSRGDMALVLTCGHIFRSSAGKGRITIDMFGPGAPKGVEAQVVGYHEESDVGLISFRPGVPVRAARLVPPSYRVERGAPVVNIGCDNGTEPTAHESQISAIDKYLGPPNLEVAGQPVQGRSGGGLFNADGQVIGVCNAADPADNEGLYAAAASIHALLDREGLASVYSGDNTAIAQAKPTGPQPLAPLVAVNPPNMPADMPKSGSGNLALTSEHDQAESYAQQRTPAQQASVPLSASEQAALDQLRNQSPGAEVVCIVRSIDNPRAKSEIIVLDNASPAFLQQLASEQQRQGARHLTSLAEAPPKAARPIAVRPRGAAVKAAPVSSTKPASNTASQSNDSLVWLRPAR